MRSFYLFAFEAFACAAQPDQHTAAVHWVDHYASVYQVPRELIHSIIEVESGWRAHAVSSKGAVGLMQLMPSTAATFGVTNRFEVEQNIRGGVWRIWPDSFECLTATCDWSLRHISQVRTEFCRHA